MMRFTLLFLLIIIGLSGCCTSRPQLNTYEPSDAATIQLAEAATAISQSLTQLSAMQQANTPTPKICLPITHACEMQNLVSVDWAGPIAPLVDRIGCMTNYRVRKIGAPPAIPVLISINARNTLLADVLRDIAFQAGTKACISVDSKHRIIELRYRHMCDCQGSCPTRSQCNSRRSHSE